MAITRLPTVPPLLFSSWRHKCIGGMKSMERAKVTRLLMVSLHYLADRALHWIKWRTAPRRKRRGEDTAKSKGDATKGVVLQDQQPVKSKLPRRLQELLLGWNTVNYWRFDWWSHSCFSICFCSSLNNGHCSACLFSLSCEKTGNHQLGAVQMHFTPSLHILGRPRVQIHHDTS